MHGRHEKRKKLLVEIESGLFSVSIIRKYKKIRKKRVLLLQFIERRFRSFNF